MTRNVLSLGGGVLGLALWWGVPAQADQKSDALLKQVEAAAKAAQTLSATVTVAQKGEGQDLKLTGTAKLKKPNFARIVLSQPMAMTLVSNGKKQWTLTNDTYQTQPIDSKGHTLNTMGILPLSLFFNPSSTTFGSFKGTEKRYLGSETLAGKKYEVIEVKGKQPVEYTLKMYVGPEKLITRIVVDMKQEGQTASSTFSLSNVQLNAPLAKTVFTFKPPKTAHAYVVPEEDNGLLPVGKPAPKLSLPTPTGGHVSLADLTKTKKAIIVNFWFYG